MARHKKHPEHENLERWLVSYADFITLLFATFTALYAIAQSKLTDDHKVAEEITRSFQQETLLKGIASVFQGQSTPTAKPNPAFEETGKGEGVIGKYESLVVTHGEKKAMEELLEELDEIANEIAEELEDAIQAEKLNPALGVKDQVDDLEGIPLRGLEVSLQERGLKISFDSRLLFPSGSAQLNPKSLKFLDGVAERLMSAIPTHLIHIEGHTDNSPITGRYPSNWELSSARACTVVRHFVNQHRFAPTDLAAVGYADSRPVTTNSTAENRAKNRRIDIILHSRAEEKTADPRIQQRKERILIDTTHRYSIENKVAKEKPLPQIIPNDAVVPLKPAPKPAPLPVKESVKEKEPKAVVPLKVEEKPKESIKPKLKESPTEEIRLPIFNENGEALNQEKSSPKGGKVSSALRYKEDDV